MSTEIERLNNFSPESGLPLYLSNGQRILAADVDVLIEELNEWMVNPGNTFIWDFAYAQQMTMPDIQKIAERYPRFAQSVEMLKLRQESLLWNMGLGSKNSNFIKWMLCTHHGYRNDPDQGVSVQDLMKEALKSVVKTVDYSKDE